MPDEDPALLALVDLLVDPGEPRRPAPEAGGDRSASRPGDVQQDLAARIRQRNLQRNERLARLRPAAAPRARGPVGSGIGPGIESAIESAGDAALEEFLRALTGGGLPAGPEAAVPAGLEAAMPVELEAAVPVELEAAVPAGAGILRFPEPRQAPPAARTEARAEAPAEPPAGASPEISAGAGLEAAPGDLDRLPGAGTGLVWALQRAGIARLGDLAALDPAELVARLGPLGRLVPAARWIEAARTEI